MPEEPLDKHERRKDFVQEAVDSGAATATSIFSIVAGAVRDVTREIGDFATDMFELRDASRQAAEKADDEPPPPADTNT